MQFTIKCKNGNLTVTFLTNNATCANDVRLFMQRYRTVCAYTTRYAASVCIEQAFQRETKAKELVIYFK